MKNYNCFTICLSLFHDSCCTTSQNYEHTTSNHALHKEFQNVTSEILQNTIFFLFFVWNKVLFSNQSALFQWWWLQGTTAANLLVQNTDLQPRGKKDTLGLINEACLALTDGRQQGHLSVSSSAGILPTGGNGKHMVTTLRKEEHYSRGAYTQILMHMIADVFATGSILVRKYQLPSSMFYSQWEFKDKRDQMWLSVIAK